MRKTCVCGKCITRGDLCNICLNIYGANRSEWPEWLKFLVNDMRKELRRERRIDEHEISFTDLGVY